MPHIIEPAKSGRSKCHGCGRTIGKAELRFGERLPNPFAEGETTHWFHPRCGAYKRPEPMLEVLAGVDIDERAELLAIAEEGVEYRRLPRVNGIQRAPSGRAQCRHCRETIVKGAWRIPLVFHEDGRFNAAGFVHLSCAAAYFETTNILERMLHFAGDLTAVEVAEIRESAGV